MARLPSETYKTAYIVCRRDSGVGLGHAWDWVEWFAYQSGYRRIKYCKRCETRCEELMNSRMEITWRKYIYPPDYSWIGVKAPVREWRQTLFREANKIMSWGSRTAPKPQVTWTGPRKKKVKHGGHKRNNKAQRVATDETSA